MCQFVYAVMLQDFAFPDALRLWDSLLSDPNGRMDCLLRICTAMLMAVRTQLLDGDFAANVKLLQRYPCSDVGELLQAAAALPPLPPSL